MILRFVLWLSRRWHDYLDATAPKIEMRGEWRRHEHTDR